MPLPDLTDTPAVNRQSVTELQGRNSEGETLLMKLYSIFVDETPTLVNDLREQLAARELNGVYETIHQIKGSAAAMGASRIFTLTKAALELSRDERIFEVPDLPEMIEAEFELYKEMLASYLP